MEPERRYFALYLPEGEHIHVHRSPDGTILSAVPMKNALDADWQALMAGELDLWVNC